jgi:hypothetical protein
MAPTRSPVMYPGLWPPPRWSSSISPVIDGEAAGFRSLHSIGTLFLWVPLLIYSWRHPRGVDWLQTWQGTPLQSKKDCSGNWPLQT